MKLEVMKYLKDRKWHSYYDIHMSLEANYESLKKYLNFLKRLNFVDLIIISPNQSGSGGGSYKAKITKQGMKWIRRN